MCRPDFPARRKTWNTTLSVFYHMVEDPRGMLHRQGLVDDALAQELAEAVNARLLAIQSGSDGDLPGEHGTSTPTDVDGDLTLPSSAL